MCGIFTVIKKSASQSETARLGKGVRSLFEFSRKRGREASGIGYLEDSQLNIVKSATDADRLLKKKQIADFLDSAPKQNPYIVFGHARLVTNGSETNQENNQPVIKGETVVVHNGIIVNDAELWAKNPDLERKFDVDTEIFASLCEKYHRQSSLFESVAKVFNEIKGTANVLVYSESSHRIVFGTNHGSLHWCHNPKTGFFVAASERHALEALKSSDYSEWMTEIESGDRGTIGELDLSTFELRIDDYRSLEKTPVDLGGRSKHFNVSLFSEAKEVFRCTRCILPSNFPLIQFDSDGVCNFCRSSEPFSYRGKEALESTVEKYRRVNGNDCVVAFSGGRDSSYGLHYIKNELGMNPIAYTYDWGMVTDIARRNISRMCESLNIEHILRSANIPQKRKNIRKNIEAWLKQPDLGMIPLLMAGDKQFYYYAQQVSKENNIPLVIFCAGNPYEKTEFKTGFCGIEDHKGAVVTRLGFRQKFQIALYYAKQFSTNWRYWNSSVVDTLFAYYSTYILKDDCVYLYEYIPFEEKKIDDILINQYGWEVAADAKSTWRIGDGTACFYNFVYHTIAGFSEHDTFRSHQIRNGDITREEALATIDSDNEPRFDAMAEYASLVGFNLNEAINVIMSAKKR